MKKTCGHYGGRTSEDLPCTRKAGWGTNSEKGRCADHPDSEAVGPDELAGPARAIYDDIRESLNQIGLFVPADKYLISALANAIYMRDKARKVIENEGLTDWDGKNDRDRRHPCFMQFKQMQEQIKTYSNMLGLSPHGRNQIKEQLEKGEGEEGEKRSSIENMMPGGG